MLLQENQIVIIRSLLELIETSIEGIRHIQYRLGSFENMMSSTIYLLEDVVHAVLCIKRTFSLIGESIEQINHFLNYIYNIEFILSNIVTDYENKQFDNALFRLDKYLIPEFSGLYKETSEYYFPFIVS